MVNALPRTLRAENAQKDSVKVRTMISMMLLVMISCPNLKQKLSQKLKKIWLTTVRTLKERKRTYGLLVLESVVSKLMLLKNS
jgi:hypothetical protein